MHSHRSARQVLRRAPGLKWRLMKTGRCILLPLTLSIIDCVNTDTNSQSKKIKCQVNHNQSPCALRTMSHSITVTFHSQPERPDCRKSQNLILSASTTEVRHEGCSDVIHFILMGQLATSNTVRYEAIEKKTC